MSRFSSDCKALRDGTRRYLHDIWQPLTLLVIVITFTATFFTVYNPYDKSRYKDDFFFCNADGKLEKIDYDYKPFWDPRLYFTINIAFGKFTFSTAKVLDAAWDALVGRGGQFVAAVLTYRTLRRSLTLTMESRTVPINAVASLYCRQIQLMSVEKLVHTMFRHWKFKHLMWQRSIHEGRGRLSVQLFICTYVLFFATLVSVMTGYRAQLSGFVGYDALFPVDQLMQPRLAFHDAARVGLSDIPMFTHDKIWFPEIRSSLATNIAEILALSGDFEEPYGALVDCR
jgi:hypothetical protein